MTTPLENLARWCEVLTTKINSIDNKIRKIEEIAVPYPYETWVVVLKGNDILGKLGYKHKINRLVFKDTCKEYYLSDAHPEIRLQVDEALDDLCVEMAENIQKGE